MFPRFHVQPNDAAYATPPFTAAYATPPFTAAYAMTYRSAQCQLL